MEYSPLIPDGARRALHNLPVFEKRDVAMDLIEYPELEHVAIRCYENQLGALNVPDRQMIFERMVLMQNVLRTFGVSASLEKVAGDPPPYVR